MTNRSAGWPPPATTECGASPAIELKVGRLSLPAAIPAGHEALKFLGHWVGDIHQPMHVSFEDDRGANGITTTGVCSGNMHSAWDTCLLEQAVGTDPTAAVNQILPEITPADRAAWISTGPVAWANESFAIATAAGTGYCVESAGVCAYEAGNIALDPSEPQKTVTIDTAYVAASTPIIRDRLKRAGVRLAHLVDEALKPLGGYRRGVELPTRPEP